MTDCAKKTFLTQQEATQKIAEIKTRSSSGKKPIRAYRCSLCLQWHLTSMKRKRFEQVFSRHKINIEAAGEYWEQKLKPFDMAARYDVDLGIFTDQKNESEVNPPLSQNTYRCSDNPFVFVRMTRPARATAIPKRNSSVPACLPVIVAEATNKPLATFTPTFTPVNLGAAQAEQHTIFSTTNKRINQQQKTRSSKT